MGKPQLLLQECGTLNRVFAAFFINEAEKLGVNFDDSKPQMENIASLNKDGHFFTQDDKTHGIKDFFHGKVAIENIDMEKFRSVGIHDFFDDEIRKQISDVAKEFSYTVGKHRYCDFVFSSLPDVQPFIYDCILDPQCNFRSRLVIAGNIMNKTYNAVFEFYCLLMTRFREVEAHDIYGKSYKDVDYMSNTDLVRYNKQPEMNK